MVTRGRLAINSERLINDSGAIECVWRRGRGHRPRRRRSQIHHRKSSTDIAVGHETNFNYDELIDRWIGVNLSFAKGSYFESGEKNKRNWTNEPHRKCRSIHDNTVCVCERARVRVSVRLLAVGIREIYAYLLYITRQHNKRKRNETKYCSRTHLSAPANRGEKNLKHTRTHSVHICDCFHFNFFHPHSAALSPAHLLRRFSFDSIWSVSRSGRAHERDSDQRFKTVRISIFHKFPRKFNANESETKARNRRPRMQRNECTYKAALNERKNSIW